ncbi:FAR-17a/AIG1-like protein-domain-containing protein [Mycena rebaudengoi]|nr:FAR-17a/AIG1-like protein-domain-containing protein [Mycena rebaudengoi]
MCSPCLPHPFDERLFGRKLFGTNTSSRLRHDRILFAFIHVVKGMARTSSIVLHASAICTMSYGFNALSSLTVHSSITSQYGGHFQFLTIQGLAIAWLTTLVGLAADFLPAMTGLRAIKRSLFIVAMPVATIVSSIYWTLILLFPRLILREIPSQETLDFLPLRIDLALHAAPCLSLLADFIIFEQKYSRTEIVYVAPVLTMLCTAWYGWWVERCGSKNGTFPYPFLTENPLEIRMRIYAGAACLAYVSFYALNMLHPTATRRSKSL